MYLHNVEISEYLLCYQGLPSNCRDIGILSVLLGLTLDYRDIGIFNVHSLLNLSLFEGLHVLRLFHVLSHYRKPPIYPCTGHYQFQTIILAKRQTK